MPQFHSHTVMPIRERAVAESVPDPENKPGKGRHQNNNKMNPPRFFPDPAEKDERNP